MQVNSKHIWKLVVFTVHSSQPTHFRFGSQLSTSAKNFPVAALCAMRGERFRLWSKNQIGDPVEGFEHKLGSIIPHILSSRPKPPTVVRVESFRVSSLIRPNTCISPSTGCLGVSAWRPYNSTVGHRLDLIAVGTQDDNGRFGDA